MHDNLLNISGEGEEDMDVEVEKVHVPSEVFGSLKPAVDDDEEEGNGQ